MRAHNQAGPDARVNLAALLEANFQVKVRMLKRAAFEHGRTVREQAEFVGGIAEDVIRAAEGKSV